MGVNGHTVVLGCLAAASVCAGVAMMYRRYLNADKKRKRRRGGKRGPPVGWATLTNRSVLSIDCLSKSEVKIYLDVAVKCREAVLKSNKLQSVLEGRILALLFYEPSTRTRCSFESAMKRLGGQTLGVIESPSGATSSVSKGETLADTSKMLSAYAHGIVVRHPEVASAGITERSCSVPVINAGNGTEEHPTQALLDLFTIYSFFPKVISEDYSLPPVRITVVGDLIHGRTTHSLVKLLARYNTKLTYVAPDALQMPRELITKVEDIYKHNGLSEPLDRQRCVEYLSDALPDSDVVYMTRIQRERLAADEKPAAIPILTSGMLDEFAPLKTKVLHPLPRLNEVNVDVDSNHRQAYFAQARNGLYMRMAILTLVFGRVDSLWRVEEEEEGEGEEEEEEDETLEESVGLDGDDGRSG